MVHTTAELEAKIGRTIGSSETSIFAQHTTFIRVGASGPSCYWRAC